MSKPKTKQRFFITEIGESEKTVYIWQSCANQQTLEILAGMGGITSICDEHAQAFIKAAKQMRRKVKV